MCFASIAASLDGHHKHAFVGTLDAQPCLLRHHNQDVVDVLRDSVLDGSIHVNGGECGADIWAMACIALEPWSKANPARGGRS
jgi:hypothetical protein